MKFIKKPLILSLLSAILLSAPWFSLPDCLILVGFVPLFVLQSELHKNSRKGFLWWVALTLTLWIISTCFWVSMATMIAALAVPLVGLVSLWPAWWLYHAVWKRSSKALAYTILATAWVALEWWYAVGDVSFPWLTLGGAFASWPALVQWYSMTGMYGGSLWIMVANIMIYTAISKPRVWIWAAAWIGIPIAGSLVMYYNYQIPSSKTIAVCSIQPNIDPYTEKYNTNGLDIILPLASSAPIETELFVAPETAMPGVIYLDNGQTNDAGVERVQKFLAERGNGARFIIGATTSHGEYYYNSALMIDSSRIEYYHKSKLVMGVETVPDWLAGVAKAIDLGGYVGSLGRQNERTVFSSNVSSAICYESIYGEYFSQWAVRGANLMTIITNDGWWGDTPGYVHHKDYARLRAIENRRAIVRSANTGISAVIDPRGDVIESLAWDKRGIISARVPVSDKVTPYMQWGDMTARLSIYVALLSLLYFVAKHYKSKIVK